jgi:hypothetical protein
LCGSKSALHKTKSRCGIVTTRALRRSGLIKLRAVQGVLRFAQQFGASRLEAACRRANHFGTPSYKAVKLILQKGLDQSWLSTEPVESGATTYTHGGRFCRDTQTLLIH